MSCGPQRTFLPRAARECYKWLLCPVQETATASKPTVETFPLNTTAARLGARSNAFALRMSWSSRHGLLSTYEQNSKSFIGKKASLPRKAMAFWEDTLRYLYLPRLKDREALAKAIRAGAASRDFFALAHSQTGTGFEGFQFGNATVQLDDTLLLIEPEAAKLYEANHSKPVEPLPKSETSRNSGGNASGSSTTSDPASLQKVRSFTGWPRSQLPPPRCAWCSWRTRSSRCCPRTPTPR